ncbi:MAG: hypothetical protein MMC23_005088 [Stictis urceolatum]|nr:hypothetical protein [Stictis urceolata]
MTSEQSAEAADKSSQPSSTGERSLTHRQQYREAPSQDRSLLSVGADSQPSRKRPASQISQDEDLEEEDDYEEEAGGSKAPTISSQTTQSRPSDASSVCLCQPDPKVPRPRNAFILFRQHHQSEVAKSNPGLANPEISKIIGDYWRRASIENKSRWKALAEEEKARHQKQYPNYRYQPRRTGRNSSGSDRTDPDAHKCPKCGGRSMAARLPTPTGPTRPTHPSSPPSSARIPPPVPTPASRGRCSIHAAPSPPIGPARGSYSRGPYEYPWHRDSGYGSLPYIHGAERPDEDGSPLMSPEAKRRRYDSSYLPGATRAGSLANAVSGAMVYGRRGSSLPRPEFMSKHVSVNPPPRGVGGGGLPSGSLTLAPLKIQAQGQGQGQEGAQAKAVEAMVMSIPPLNKIRVLSKISPPLQAPGASSPPLPIRGAIIAIEGSDDEALKVVITHLRDLLQKDDEHRVRLYYGGRFSAKRESDGFAAWLELIRDWHRESAAIRKFITTPVVSDSLSPQVSPSTVPGQPVKEAAKDGVKSYDLRTRDSDAMDTSPDAASKTPGQASQEKPAASAQAEIKGPMPVAIIPRFQLSLTDQAASAVPIADEYSPTDHWQWMATLWRGITGPDVTIVVKSASAPGHEEGTSAVAGGSNTHAGNAQGGDRAAKDGNGHKQEKGPEVEVRLSDHRAVVLRCEKESRVGESGLRRMGFEVGEWLRERQRDGKRL